MSALIDLADRSDQDFALTGHVCVLRAFLSEDQSSCREVRSLDDPYEVLNVAFRLVYKLDTCVDRLSEIVRRYRGRHSYGDTVGSVDQEIRYSRWEYYRLLFLSVVVVHEVDGVLLDISDHLQRERGHPRFCISRSRCSVAVDRTKVAVAVYERIPRGEVLSHFDHGLIYGAVSVRVVFTHDLTDDTRRFLVRLIRCDAERVHAVQNPPVNRLEPVSDIRERTADYDAHRIVDIRILHLIVYLVLDYGAFIFYNICHYYIPVVLIVSAKCVPQEAVDPRCAIEQAPSCEINAFILTATP